MNAFSLSSLLTAALCLGGCADTTSNQAPAPHNASVNPQDAAFIEKLEKLQRKNPVRNAQQAISRGERVFLCNAGRSRTVPGLEPAVYAAVKNNCPTRCLEGVTDALYGSNHARYLDAALQYSARWNQVMLDACR